MKKNEASSTAYKVAQGILYTAQNPRYRGLVSDEIEESYMKILSSSPMGRKCLKQLGNKLFLALVPVVEKLLLPNICLHYALRKRHIEDCVITSINNGKTQIVNLGAGFDTLALRLHKKFPDVNFIEIDHPATQKSKISGVLSLEENQKNLNFLPIDFSTQNLSEELNNSTCFDKNRPTLFILEGVLMYLKEEDVIKLFHAMSDTVESSVVFTAVQSFHKSKKLYGPLLKTFLIFKREQMNWTCDERDLQSFLDSLGYQLIELSNAEEFGRKHLKTLYKEGEQQAEYIAVANYNS